jgi:hypothetical protein
MRVCQFRHDGNLELAMQRRPQGRRVRKTYSSILQACINLSNDRAKGREVEARNPKPPYPNFAVIEIFAFSTFDTGQPFSAASAYF